MADQSAQKKPKRNLSPEHRQKLSELAKQRYAEGKWGGAKYGALGGRPRKKPDRTSALVAEAARDEPNAEALIQVFRDAIHPSQPMGLRLRGAELWLNVEREEAKVALQEAEADAKVRSRDELLAILSQKLTAGPASTILRRQIESETGIVDAEVVESSDGAQNQSA